LSGTLAVVAGCDLAAGKMSVTLPDDMHMQINLSVKTL
jgi:hypothetical protein